MYLMTVFCSMVTINPALPRGRKRGEVEVWGWGGGGGGGFEIPAFLAFQ